MLARAVRVLANRDGRLALQAYVVLAAVDLGVRHLGLTPVWRLVRLRGRPRREPAGEEEVGRLVQAVRRAARRHRRPRRCLAQSLTLAWLLARRGIPSDLRLGVRKEDGEVLAHAWLECGGRPLDATGGSPEHFRPLIRPAAAPGL